MRDAVDITRLYQDRQKARGDTIQRMEKVRDAYNGDVVIPMPQFQDREQENYVANMLQIGLDNYARRIASTDPDVDCPPLDPRKPTSVDRAATRRKAVLGWWEASDMRVKRYRRARHLLGYAASPISLRPDLDRGIPIWVPRNPLATFTAPCVDPDSQRPADAIFATKMPLKHVNRNWPHAVNACYTSDDVRDSPDRLVTILEYDDAEQVSYILVGDANNVRTGSAPGHYLSMTENKAGMCLSLHPQRITLDRPAGQFDGIMGMWQMQAKLMALEVMAVQRGVFPDQYLVSRAGEQASFLSGPHPGWSGRINIVENGEIQQQSIQAGFQTNPTIDRLERAQRLEAGISPEFGGESGTNIRTGRRGDSILSALVDFPIQEAQELLARSAEEENYRASKIAKAWFGDTPRSFYVRWKGAKGHVDYTPNKDFDSDYTSVTYPMVGADVQNLTIGVGQLIGTELMSKTTGRRLHPWIDDPDLEGDLVVSEGMQTAVLASLQAKANSGELSIVDVARITQLIVEDNQPPYKAVQMAQEEAQRRQAQVDAQGQPDLVPAGAPEAQPGLAVPGQGAEAATMPTIPESGQGLASLDQLFMRLRGTSMSQMAG